MIRFLAVVAAVVAGVGAGIFLAGPTQPASGTSGALLHAETSANACSGPQPPNFVGEQLVSVHPTKDVPTSVIYIPSYDPSGVITSQWPEPCGESYGTHYRQYLFVSNGPVTNPRAVLPIATGPPVSAECVAKTYPTADGNVYPVLCGDHVSVLAWIPYAELRASVMRLGRTATRCQVVVAEEGSHAVIGVPDEESFTIPEMYNSYVLAHAYYGWTFTVPSLAASPPRWLASCGAAAVRNWD